jgi:hypothetical protein
MSTASDAISILYMVRTIIDLKGPIPTHYKDRVSVAMLYLWAGNDHVMRGYIDNEVMMDRMGTVANNETEHVNPDTNIMGDTNIPDSAREVVAFSAEFSAAVEGFGNSSEKLLVRAVHCLLLHTSIP